MPTFAQGSRSSLSYITEVTFGTTPSGNFQNIPFSTHTLNLTKDLLSGNDIQSDRMTRVSRHGNRQVGGDIVADLRDTDYDDFFEAAFLNTWDASPTDLPDVLKVGTTPKFFSIEDYAADVDQARLFTGVTVSTMNVSIAPGQMVTCTFGMVGKDMTISATEKTQDAATGAEPFDSYSGAIEIGDVGSLSASGAVTSVDFTLTNTFAPLFVIGDDSAPAIQSGRAVVEGTFNAYFEDETLINRFLNETESALFVSVNDTSSANEYSFLFPRIKINSANVGVAGEEARIVECAFEALYDDTEGSNLVMKRPDTT